MSTSDIQLAREWAGRVYAQEPDTQATCRVIQSLPDTVVDGDKLRKIYDLYDAGKINLHEAFRYAVELIPAPAPRTLADMALEELKTHVGGEVMVDGWANPTMLISVIGDEGAVLARRLNRPWPFVEVHPLSDLTPVAAPEPEAEDTP